MTTLGMSSNFDYTLLITSLPPHPQALFTTKAPISRIQLNRRLSLLSEKDSLDLAQIEALLHWSKMSELTDSHLLRQGTHLIGSMASPCLKELLLWRLQLRTLIAALRYRHQGLTFDSHQSFIGFGNYLRHIHQHWQQPDFGLSYLIPWLNEANTLLIKGQSLALEKLILNQVWLHYQRIAQEHYFNFEAVVIYVLRWDIIQRWQCYDKEEAIRRFDALVLAGLTDE